MNCATEEWKPVLGYEGLYEISNMGRVRALFCTTNFHKPNRILKPWLLKTGYLQVHLMRPGEKRKAFCIHHLLLEAFVSPRPADCEVRHLNGCRSDNALTNLAWGTHKENARDMVQHGHAPIGDRAWNTRLTSQDVILIREMRDRGVKLSDIAKQFAISISSASTIVLRKTWSHV